jgi:hypothetical protein
MAEEVDMAKTLLAAATFLSLSAGAASAAVIGYVASPANDSVAWGNAVTALGATINTSINFNTMALGTPVGSFYTASQGVTISQTGSITVSSSGLFDGYGGTNTGEGAWTPSKHLRASSNVLATVPAESVTFSFATPVAGGGIFLVDYFGSTPWSITARDANNLVLGSYTAVTGQSFQLQGTGTNPTGPYKYFLGIESTIGDIQSLTIGRPGTGFGQGGDNVGLDDFRFAVLAPAAVPEPASLLALGLGLLGLGAVRRRI